MRKLNSFIFHGLIITLTLAGCGMPGPLYQEEQKKPTATPKTSEQPKNQQEDL